MNLLLQTIQEYLKDKHPNWATLQHGKYDSITYIYIQTILGIYITLNTTNKTISTYTPQKLYCTQSTPYTEHTLLQQLTETIHQIEHTTLQQITEAINQTEQP